MTVKHIDRAIYPNTNHGWTVVEWMFFSRGGELVSPLIPCTAWCEGLTHKSAEPMECNIGAETAMYADDGVQKTVTDESVSMTNSMRSARSASAK